MLSGRAISAGTANAGGGPDAGIRPRPLSVLQSPGRRGSTGVEAQGEVQQVREDVLDRGHDAGTRHQRLTAQPDRTLEWEETQDAFEKTSSYA